MEFTYGLFGFEFSLELSTRPENYLGQIETWNEAEAVSPLSISTPHPHSRSSVLNLTLNFPTPPALLLRLYPKNGFQLRSLYDMKHGRKIATDEGARETPSWEVAGQPW